MVVAISLGLGAWTNGEAQQLIWLNTPFLGASRANSVSADGSVAVGQADRYAFRWTAQTGSQILSTEGVLSSNAYGVSADGTVVVGCASFVTGQLRAVRWVNGTIQELGALGGDISEARGVSADGGVVVGWARNARGQLRAFRWTAQTGLQKHAQLRVRENSANGVTADR
ncbi:MAG: hypothetical protein NZM28_00090, partial [Fimbriimonadales bacterium]|nr:hypothetical protein [Fimbriimonadales bacterium]